MSDPKLTFLSNLERRSLWLSTWMIHHANHVRENRDGLKVGGHQSSSASLCTIMAALYGAVLRPEDRVAVKPHAAPVFHALQYLFGQQTRANLVNFRGYKGAQSYPSRTKDVDDVDFSTGSVGLGAAQTIFAALARDYVHAHGWGKSPNGRMVSLIGDAELDEGNIFEALLEGWKHGLRNCWWVVDYNRQSLDAVIREGLWQRFEAIFRNFGWDVVILKHGTLQQAAFARPGGAALRDWIDACPNQLYAALTYQGGAAWRRRLLDDLGDQGPVTALIDGFDDEGLARLMTNLGGHDLPALLGAFDAAAQHDRPTCFIAYTIKGFGLPLAGHKDNHAGLMTPAQMAVFRAAMGVAEGQEWEPLAGLTMDRGAFLAALKAVPFVQRGPRRLTAPEIAAPDTLAVRARGEMSTQGGWGQILSDFAATDHPLAARIVTTSPDVTVSTNLGGWVNRRGLFAREEMADTFKREKIPSAFTWEFSPKGQHMELGIAEMNLFLMLSALGLSHSLWGERLIPIGTLYDPFIERGLDALNYACYQDARFILAATPSGVTLAPEGGAHQSIGTPLIGMKQDGLLAFEPAFVDELAEMLRWSFSYVQRGDKAAPPDAPWLRDAVGGSVYLRLSTRVIEQPGRAMTPDLARGIVDGAYWLRPPGPNPEVIVAFAGAVAPEAIAAVGLMAEDRRDVGLLNVTSADRLHAGWSAAQRARRRGDRGSRSLVERLLAPLPRDCLIVSVLDGHPATLAWLGAVHGHRGVALGTEHFGETGTIADLYRAQGIDTEAILRAVEAYGRPIRHWRTLG